MVLFTVCLANSTRALTPYVQLPHNTPRPCESQNGLIQRTVKHYDTFITHRQQLCFNYHLPNHSKLSLLGPRVAVVQYPFEVPNSTRPCIRSLAATRIVLPKTPVQCFRFTGCHAWLQPRVNLLHISFTWWIYCIPDSSCGKKTTSVLPSIAYRVYRPKLYHFCCNSHITLLVQHGACACLVEPYHYGAGFEPSLLYAHCCTLFLSHHFLSSVGR